ncbi:Pentatricopeptide repeat-containing protein [Actinidia chinensis var. chinensis]|uniref:Pentatricopeptide repeat-containing protein n=1 Tax=Actinidia chinensis var. chinensis TaxID=1590841 RepID=A0A2R6RK92_ACTCC|nr:Pentatricopeptide repeat-containing protein [Actinidia chinensis var. chinensis]
MINNVKHSFKSWHRFMSIAESCSNMRQLKATHAVFITNGLHRNNFAISKLLAFCALSDAGDLSYTSLLFTQISEPNSFIYNTLIRAYSRSSQPKLSLHYFHLMLNDDTLCPNHHTFPFVLVACANASCVIFGKEVHNWVLKNGLASSDGHIQTALIRFYLGCKVLEDARKVFDEIPRLDVVQCNVLMNGYIQLGSASEALSVLQDMLVSEIEPDEFCVTTGITACADLGALVQGKWIHEYVKKRKELVSDVFVGTALVDMYVKCGCIDSAVEVFERMPERNAFPWAAMIGGFALHGYARKAISYLERMQVEDGLRPDGVVLLGVLTACTHAGFQKEGQFLLHNMEARYGVVPEHEHYSCVVDLLCRAGQLDEALVLIRRMPMKPLASVWGALLSGCRNHNNVDLAEVAVKELLQMENSDRAEEDGAYVQLSNIYLAAGKCEDAGTMRKMIGDRGLKKTPGCSMIEVDGEVNEFVSGDVLHPHIEKIHAIVELMSLYTIHRPLKGVKSKIRVSNTA